MNLLIDICYRFSLQEPEWAWNEQCRKFTIILDCKNYKFDAFALNLYVTTFLFLFPVHRQM